MYLPPIAPLGKIGCCRGHLLRWPSRFYFVAPMCGPLLALSVVEGSEAGRFRVRPDAATSRRLSFRSQSKPPLGNSTHPASNTPPATLAPNAALPQLAPSTISKSCPAISPTSPAAASKILPTVPPLQSCTAAIARSEPPRRLP